MNSKLKWLVVPLTVATLVACGAEEDPTDETDTTTGGTTTTEAGVEISLGSGSGSSFNVGVMTSGVGSATLSAGGTTTVAVNIVDANNNNATYQGVPVTVTFDSGCTKDGKASISPAEVSTSSGVATATYEAKGCYGTDVISASIDSASASVSIEVALAEVNSVNFTQEGFEPAITYANSPSPLPNQSIVEFKVIDKDGNPIEGQTVTYSLSSSNPTGVALSQSSSVTDSEGLARTRVNASESAMMILVNASITSVNGEVITSQSLPMAATTGIADVGSFSMKADEACVANAYNIGGVTTTLTARAADRNNHAVADGTVIYFEVEDYAGRFPIGTCETANGVCSLDWESDSYRDKVADGRATVTAFTVGEDSFVDIGSMNGLYDVGEAFVSQSEVFYDYDYDDNYDAATEGYWDYNNDGEFYNDATVASPKYRGVLCTQAAIDAGHCAQTSIHVWDKTQIVMNTIGMDVAVVATGADFEAPGGFSFTVTDENGNYPPAGTTVSVESDDFTAKIVGEEKVYPRGSCGEGSAQFAVSFKAKDDSPNSGTITIKVAPPGDVSLSSISQTVTIPAP